ncbi:MAG: sulfotransferase [Sphingomonas sp.]|uniref:tetratricopeptide repeat-containing sulfotransferase family protein n=1 Tax=Sphingomonas sp. TaxID=28214 RepID=UPI001ACBE381|nr:tetratricopeptide repeat-containing sulfotransferase family protein [Sphingomonas sp.]MBN8814893.1 sulfotransferase [Sphingomonas sp.]
MRKLSVSGQTLPPLDNTLDWRRRAAKLLAKGDRKGAAKAFQRYIAAPMTQPLLRSAQASIARRDFASAEFLLDQHLASDPDDPAALHLLGQVALATGKFGAAEAALRRAIEIVPAFAEARYRLALACLSQGKFDLALAEADHLLRTAPRHLDYLRMRAAAQLGRGDAVKAAETNAALVQAHPGRADLLLAYGNSLRPLRRAKDAAAAYRGVIDLAPHMGEAWWQLANMKIAALDDEDVATIRTILASDAPSGDDRCHLNFALARALEDRGDYGPAMEAYRVANRERLRIQPEVPGITGAELADRAIALFTPEFLAAHEGMGDPSRAPIFILGMPRSGSTLVEQILAAHPQIEGMQELPELGLVVRTLDNGGHPGAAAYPESLADCGPDRLRALGAEYLAGVAAKRRTDRPHFLDKQWSNCLHVGLINLILPNARIIDTRRDPLACCLSMFRQHFARGASFTYSIDSLAQTYRAYDRLIAHFDAVRPGRIKRIQLDHLISDTEATVRDLLDHLELPFAPECLRFHESDRPVFTPSAEQVRRPINRDADALVAGFAPFVDDLRAALGNLFAAS